MDVKRSSNFKYSKLGFSALNSTLILPAWNLIYVAWVALAWRCISLFYTLQH